MLRIEVHQLRPAAATGGVRLRATLFNDGFEPMVVSRNAFVGPNISDASDGAPRAESVEPTFGGPEEPLTLHPFTFYGRERTFEDLRSGEATVHAYYRSPDGTDEISASREITSERLADGEPS